MILNGMICTVIPKPYKHKKSRNRHLWKKQRPEIGKRERERVYLPKQQYSK